MYQFENVIIADLRITTRGIAEWSEANHGSRNKTYGNTKRRNHPQRTTRES
jgi:hypothetical protein